MAGGHVPWCTRCGKGHKAVCEAGRLPCGHFGMMIGKGESWRCLLVRLLWVCLMIISSAAYAAHRHETPYYIYKGVLDNPYYDEVSEGWVVCLGEDRYHGSFFNNSGERCADLKLKGGRFAAAARAIRDALNCIAGESRRVGYRVEDEELRKMLDSGYLPKRCRR